MKKLFKMILIIGFFVAFSDKLFGMQKPASLKVSSSSSSSSRTLSKPKFERTQSTPVIGSTGIVAGKREFFEMKTRDTVASKKDQSDPARTKTLTLTPQSDRSKSKGSNADKKNDKQNKDKSKKKSDSKEKSKSLESSKEKKDKPDSKKKSETEASSKKKESSNKEKRPDRTGRSSSSTEERKTKKIIATEGTEERKSRKSRSTERTSEDRKSRKIESSSRDKEEKKKHRSDGSVNVNVSISNTQQQTPSSEPKKVKSDRESSDKKKDKSDKSKKKDKSDKSKKKGKSKKKAFFKSVGSSAGEKIAGLAVAAIAGAAGFEALDDDNDGKGKDIASQAPAIVGPAATEDPKEIAVDLSQIPGGALPTSQPAGGQDIFSVEDGSGGFGFN